MKRVLMVLVLIAAMIAVTATMVMAAEDSGQPTWLGIAGYVVGVLLNIGAVGAIRAKAQAKGKEFLQSGRFAIFAVFALCFVELLVTGKFEAFNNGDSLIALCQQAWTMAAATIGVHALGKTASQALEA